MNSPLAPSHEYAFCPNPWIRVLGSTPWIRVPGSPHEYGSGYTLRIRLWPSQRIRLWPHPMCTPLASPHEYGPGPNPWIRLWPQTMNTPLTPPHKYAPYSLYSAVNLNLDNSSNSDVISVPGWLLVTVVIYSLLCIFRRSHLSIVLTGKSLSLVIALIIYLI